MIAELVGADSLLGSSGRETAACMARQQPQTQTLSMRFVDGVSQPWSSIRHILVICTAASSQVSSCTLDGKHGFGHLQSC